MIHRFIFRYSFIFVLFLLLFLSFYSASYAQHTCPSCCAASSSRRCNGTPGGAWCVGITNCWDAAASCAPANPVNLTYTCNNTAGTSITLDWAGSTNNLGPYLLRADDISNGFTCPPGAGDICENVPNATTARTFTSSPSTAYNWWIHGTNACYGGSTSNYAATVGPAYSGYYDYSGGVAGPQASCPTLGTFTAGTNSIGGGADTACTGSACNSRDVITQIDSSYNQRVEFGATFNDAGQPTGGRLTDIQNAYIILDNDSNPGNGFYLRINYTDNGTTQTVTRDPSSSKNITLPGTSALRSAYGTGYTLTLRAALDFTTLPAGDAFTTNVYIQTNDFHGTNLGPTLVATNIEIWNGKDVSILGEFYEVAAAGDICGANRTGLTAVANFNLDPTYSPLTGWADPITNWKGSSATQPYYHYNGNTTTVSYTPVTTGSYFLISLDTRRYGGSCYNAVNGTISGAIYNEGGLTLPGTLNAAFGVRQITNVWSKVVDGNLFIDGDLNMTVETVTCAGCYLMNMQNNAVNGIPVVNGAITGVNSRYGTPTNWYSIAGAGNLPFDQTEPISYDEIKKLLTTGTYTELTGNRTLSVINPQANTVYLIGGNLTVNQNFTVAEDQFVVFIVGGNIVINQNVTSLDGIFIAEGDLTINDNATPNFNPNSKTDQLTITGVLATGGSVVINRTMGAANNFDAPVIMRFRPDMVAAISTAGLVGKQKVWLGNF